MIILGYLAAILIGISLGLIGGGGSILTVPVLVYLFHIDAYLATTYSLFIVGTTSVVGSLNYFKKGLIHLKTALIFGLPSIISVFIVRKLVLPTIPKQLFSLGNLNISKDIFLLIIFALLMIAVSISMIRKELEENNTQQQNNYGLVIFQGLFVGSITGLLGAGGGFLIIPALAKFLKMPIKSAVGTSLMIISINSLGGFMFSIFHLQVQWSFLLSITAMAITGILLGSYFSKYISSRKLKPTFGWFVLLMGIYILLKEIFL